MRDVLIAHLLGYLVHLNPAIPEKLHGLVYAVAGQVVEKGLIGLLLEGVA